MARASRKRYSELECFALGMVWRHGPCSAYELRRLMQDSPSTQWSGSAGAIYPLLRRLERAGLLAGREEATGRRGRRAYRVTPAGRAVLRRWIGPPLAREAISVAYDPLRSRARFLAALPARDRARWITAALEALDEVERRVDAWDRRYASDRDALAAAITRSGRLDVESRRAWLRGLRRAIGRAPRGT